MTKNFVSFESFKAQATAQRAAERLAKREGVTPSRASELLKLSAKKLAESLLSMRQGRHTVPTI